MRGSSRYSIYGQLVKFIIINVYTVLFHTSLEKQYYKSTVYNCDCSKNIEYQVSQAC